MSSYIPLQPNWIQYAVVGEHDRSNPNDGQIYVKIQNYTLHPRWKPIRFPAYDFAIITLERKLKFTENIRKARLPTSKTLNKSKMYGTMLFVSEWGIVIFRKVVRKLKSIFNYYPAMCLGVKGTAGQMKQHGFRQQDGEH